MKIGEKKMYVLEVSEEELSVLESACLELSDGIQDELDNGEINIDNIAEYTEMQVVSNALYKTICTKLYGGNK